MATTVKLNWDLVVEGDGKRIPAGTNGVPLSWSLTTTAAVDQKIIRLAAAAQTLIWDSATSPATSFTLLVLITTQSCMVEIVGTATADNSHFHLLGGGPPLILGSDDTEAYNAAGSFAGATQNITKIRLINTAASTAQITMIVGV